MPTTTLTGKWTGMIVYGEGYGAKEGEELYFRMELQQDGNRLTGTSEDIGGHGASPDMATLSGVVNKSEIRFIKNYASLHGTMGDNSEEVVIDRSQKGPNIYYTGVLNDKGDVVEGSWSFRQPTPTGAKPLRLEWNGSGTWIMKRKE